MTIILAALDNVWSVFPVRRVIVTFVFGLIHGFGFAGVLAELDLPTDRFAWALLQFNLGLEAGQLLIVVVVTALLFLLRRGARLSGPGHPRRFVRRDAGRRPVADRAHGQRVRARHLTVSDEARQPADSGDRRSRPEPTDQ